MSEEIRIALFGAHINSSNLGCQALTYSLLALLDSLSEELNIEFKYVLFEYEPDEICVRRMCQLIGVNEKKIIDLQMAPIFRARSYIKHFSQNIEMIKMIKSCDLAIDLTAGDSFSDIYGKERFKSLTITKWFIEKLGVPLVLGPQTYGPFLNKSNEKLAKSVLKKSKYIIARDKTSAELAAVLSEKSVEYTTDLAFQLPYVKDNKNRERIKVGLNISGLLVSDHFEKGIEDTLKLNTTYDLYIDSILNFLCNNEDYDVTLLSHVDEDLKACNKFHEKYPSTQEAPIFDNPIDIKSYISGFDIFIGARMHATIAAFTSGVATIPTAYSRKFTGLFDVVEYNKIVDLQTLNTETAVSRTIDFIKRYEELCEDVHKSLDIAKRYNTRTRDFFADAISRLILKRL